MLRAVEKLIDENKERERSARSVYAAEPQTKKSRWGWHSTPPSSWHSGYGGWYGGSYYSQDWSSSSASWYGHGSVPAPSQAPTPSQAPSASTPMASNPVQGDEAQLIASSVMVTPRRANMSKSEQT